MTHFRLIVPLVCLLALIACGSPEQRAAQHLEAAETFLEQGDLVKAKLEARNAVQIRPKDPEVRWALARIAEREGDVRAAVGQLLIIVDEAPEDLEAHVKLGTYFIFGGAVDRARDYADVALDLGPESAEAHLLDARVRFVEEDKSGARAAVGRALDYDPGLVDAVILEAGLLGDSGDIDGALGVIDAALLHAKLEDSEPLRSFRLQLLQSPGYEHRIESELKSLVNDFPDTDEYRFRLARYYGSLNRTDEAEAIIREMIQASPDEPNPKLELIALLTAQRGRDAAENELRSMLDDDPENLQLRATLGGLYEQFEQRDEAYAAYRTLAEIAPLSKEGIYARNRMIVIDIQRDEIDTAMALTEALLDDSPDNPDALMVRGAYNFSNRAFSDAIADARLVLRKEENSERALRLLARSHAMNGDEVLAIDAYRQLLALNPADRQASAELADLLALEGDVGAAEDVLRDRLEFAPDDEAAISGLIQALLVQRNVGAAESEARRLVEMNPDSAMAQYQLGRVLQAKNSVDDAVDAYKQALLQNPDSIQALRGLAKLLVDNDRAAEAVAYLREHVDANPDQLEARNLLGSLYGLLGDNDAARAEFDAVVRARPETTGAYLGLASLEPPNSAAQIAVFQRGHEANPNDMRLLLLLANALEKSGRTDEAIALYERQYERNPDDIVVTNNLAALLLDRRDDADSYRRALELVDAFESSNEPVMLDTLGWAYYRNGNYPMAVRHLERAVAAESQDAMMRYHLGMAYARSDDPVGAKRELSKALELGGDDFPATEKARATLEEIDLG